MTRIFSFLLLLIFLSFGHAEKIITGFISDAESGDFLPAANIQIEGTFKGTISNEQGEFIIRLEKVPANLVVAYIGYASTKVNITKSSPTALQIELAPIAYTMDPIIVTGEDPAVRIMRKVIERKKIWRKNLNTYLASGYTRMVLENDTSITSIMESITTLAWDKEKGQSETIHSRRQSSNIDQDQNFAAAADFSNLYDDDIDIGGSDVIGPTHPNALKHYHFKLVGERKRDEKTVYDIEVKPKGKLQPTFFGKIAVLDEDFAMIEADLKPSQSILFPLPIQSWNVHYKQQYNNYGSEYWLPTDIRMNGEIKIGFIGLTFPAIKIKRITRMSDYQINIALPDSIFKDGQRQKVDSTTIVQDADSVFNESPDVVPFSGSESIAYDKLDSTMTLAKAYKPSGPLARFVEMEIEGEETDSDTSKKESFFKKIVSGISPSLHYNRVEEAFVSIAKEQRFKGGFTLNLMAGYSTGDQRWQKQAGFSYSPKWLKRTRLKYSYADRTELRYHSPTYHPFMSSIGALLGYSDYFDYYQSESHKVELKTRLRKLRSTVRFALQLDEMSNLVKTTNYNITGRNYIQRENPELPIGNLNSLKFRLELGEEFIPFGIVGYNRLALVLEHSSPDIMNSDFDFTKFHAEANLRIPTFLKRRLLPNTLDIYLKAGTSTGTLPPQRFGILDGNMQLFSPYAAFRTLSDQPYEGDKYVGVFWEHNFRTVPFEIIGWRWPVKKNISILLHGASGKTWLDNTPVTKLGFSPKLTDDYHHEIGASLNGLFGLFRIDFTQRLDQKDFYVGFSLARLF